MSQNAINISSLYLGGCGCGGVSSTKRSPVDDVTWEHCLSNFSSQYTCPQCPVTQHNQPSAERPKTHGRINMPGFIELNYLMVCYES